MLRYEPDLFCIPAEETDVLEVHRSREPVHLDVAEPPFDAFVCHCREDSGTRVFAAFHQKKLGYALVYSTPATEEDTLEKVLAFTADLGFEMEKLNLDFGQAMREVVLRQVPVLLRPESAERRKRQRIAELEELRRLAAAHPAEEKDTVSERKAEAAQAVRKLALEERHAAAMDAIRKTLDRRLLELNAPDAMASAEQDLRELQREKERLAARCRELERTAADEAGEARRSASRVAELESEIGRIASERDEALQECRALARRAADLEEALNRRFDEAAGEQSRIGDLERDLAEVREELEAERFERELLLREKWLAERRLTEIADSEWTEPPEETPKSPPGDGELEKRIGSLADALGMAEERVSYLRDALERMAAEKEPKETPAPDGAPREGAGKGLAPIRLDPSDKERQSSLSQEPSEIPPQGRRRPPRRGAFFHPDWNRTHIGYEHPKDILEVYQSAGMVQLGLEGCPNQFCSAYIVTSKQGEQRQVHIVFELSESRVNLVYSPVKPLRTVEDYDRARQEAFKFLQVVGYSVEQLSLGSTRQQRSRALAQIAVLSGSCPRAQGF